VTSQARVMVDRARVDRGRCRYISLILYYPSSQAELHKDIYNGWTDIYTWSNAGWASRGCCRIHVSPVPIPDSTRLIASFSGHHELS
jgi:hypothetical protein